MALQQAGREGRGVECRKGTAGAAVAVAEDIDGVRCGAQKSCSAGGAASGASVAAVAAVAFAAALLLLLLLLSCCQCS